MIPTTSILTQPITETVIPDRTYKIVFANDMKKQNALATTYDGALTIASTTPLSGFTLDDNGTVSISYNTTLGGHTLTTDFKGILSLSMAVNMEDKDRISGYTDGLDAIIQAIYLILGTERYKFPIYTWNYGVELVNLFGKPISYVIAEIPYRITEALTMDKRISDVTNFEFTRNRNHLHVTFTVITNYGEISTAMEVVV